MKILLDTNVLASAAIIGINPEVAILFIVANPGFEWVCQQKVYLNKKRF